MNKEQITSWLPLVGAKAASDQSRGGWVLSNCPLGPWRHDNGKSNPEAFAVKLEAGDSFCNCFSCAWHGKQSDAVIELQLLQKTNPHAKVLQLGAAMQLIADAEDGMEIDLDSPGIEDVLFNRTSAAVIPEDWLHSFKPAYLLPWAAKYLEGRNVSEFTAEVLDIRADSSQKRVCFPVRDFQGRLRGLHGRAVEPDVKPRYRMYLYKGKNSPIVWLGENWVEMDKPIVVVEGPFDLASVARVYQNVVSPLFANPSFDKLNRMGDAVEWITLLDNGKGGDHGRQRISQKFPQHVITHLKPPEGKDPGMMAKGELISLLQDHVSLDGLEI